jgi:hypothetical protein
MSKQTATDTTLIYTKIVERYAPFFDRPEVRLRFFNNTLARQTARQEQLHRSLRRFAFIEHTRCYQWLLELGLYRLIFEELRRLLPDAPDERRRLIQQSKAPLSARLFFRLYQARHVFYGAGLATAALVLFGFYSLAVWGGRQVNTYLAQRYKTPDRPTDGATGANTALAATGVKYLPDYRPQKVWLVEQKENYERYSNGGRILTDYETDNRPRGYYVFRRGGESAEERVQRAPVGILYHTSESDLLPFTPDNNQSIQKRTQWLLEYVRRNKSYNYVIDRFGQAYRIVRDEHAANHAGHSIWGGQQNVYVGLNESFIGICFESVTDASALDEQLTEAQLIAGRALTAVLRSRYHIDDANCVTHGLVSVNPSNMLIGYHHDWVRNFPFEAMGLSDKYQVAPASVSDYGFTYDEHIIAKLGGKVWPGVAAAEAEFKRRTEQAQVSPEEMRRRLRDRYREQMEQARKLRVTPAEAEQVGANRAPSIARRQSDRPEPGK